MFDDIYSRLNTIHQSDRRTDGRTDTGRQQRPRLRIESQQARQTVTSDYHNSLIRM